MIDKTQLYIDGTWTDGVEGRRMPVINPATEEEAATAAVGTAADCDRAIAAARRAFDSGPWPTMNRIERSELLGRFADELRARLDSLAAAITLETGAPSATVRPVHLLAPLAHLDYYVEQARAPEVTTLPLQVNPRPDGTSWLGGSAQVREPVGVVSAITAYNFPFHLNVAKLGPALACGNTVVLKPSPNTPLTAALMAEAAEAAGFPPGVVNVVNGGADVGALMCTDPRVDLVSFTGSEAVGAAVAAQAAPTIKRVLLELGGKSAMIVRSDADLGAAITMGLGSVMTQSGQGCALTTRHLVHADIYDDYVSGLADRVRAIRLGDPADPSTSMGPLISAAQREKVEGFVDDARAAGSTLVTGGGRPDFARGFFVEPTVFADVDNSTRLAQEEVFGPVAAVMSFRDDDEAIAIANDSNYGLGGAIFSADAGRAFEMARRIRTGQVHINGGSGASPGWDPFGGYKRSGLGRELGEAGIADYSEIKTIKYHAG
ncbi:aldehyde dehydrogenase family protein [Gordonia sp. KTR9]|uniref:aldehyde dehydrogenase family protein n=1 Tax=Gordonia sp. KTR9 TaxID=337191 RepID=UPI001EE63EAB|nr:aldehyde dehydrogenase family protein [Gordonia sp. KTR9]